MKIILASKSGVRKEILNKYKIANDVIVSNVDEDEVKASLLAEGANPLEISKSLAVNLATGRGKGNKILFLPINICNFSKSSLKVIISGPVHSIIFE